MDASSAATAQVLICPLANMLGAFGWAMVGVTGNGTRVGVVSNRGTVGAGANALHATAANENKNGMILRIVFILLLRPTSSPIRFHRTGSGIQRLYVSPVT